MKLLLLVALAFAAEQLLSIPSREVIASKTNLWVGGETKFSSWTLSEVKAMLGYKPSVHSAHPSVEAVGVALPDEYDWRKAQPKCPFPILDQGHCGSCWAFGCAVALSDRFCIHTNGSFKAVLSPQSLVSCDVEGNMGCNGGFPRLAWDYCEVAGLPTATCDPYTSGSGETGSCHRKCVNSEEYKTKKVKLFSTRAHIGAKSIQEEILKNGPVETGFSVYQDFMSYKSGVYHHVTGEMLGGHAVRIIGWGVEGETPYWIVANSWGTSWGEKGFFRILRGKNECGFEKDAVAGLPAL